MSEREPEETCVSCGHLPGGERHDAKSEGSHTAVTLRPRPAAYALIDAAAAIEASHKETRRVARAARLGRREEYRRSLESGAKILVG